MQTNDASVYNFVNIRCVSLHFNLYVCAMTMTELSLNINTMCTSEMYLKIQNSALEVELDKIVTRIERDKICPVCKMECDITSGTTVIVYTCPSCGTKRTDLI